jgi:outer membrane receptor protein involved in Fe transport
MRCSLVRMMPRLLMAVGIALGQRVGKAAAQASAPAGEAPRFLLAMAEGRPPVPVDVSHVPVLRRRVSLALEDVPVRAALAAVRRQAGVDFVYAAEVPSLGRRVSLKAEDITVAAALTEILFDAGVDVLVSGSEWRHVTLIPRQGAPVAVGSIAGRVTEAKTQATIAGATVVVQGTSHSATTGNDGRYRITDVPAGAYSLRARYIGYAPANASVTVSEGQEATADFGLEKSAQRLDEVVTTGTIVPTAVKALPTPVNIISADDIQKQNIQRVDQIVRQAVPSAVAWLPGPSAPQYTITSVRGAASLAGGTTMKVYVDGVEVAHTNYGVVDPNSIARVEVIRGPEAAAIYGSDAIGGVMQIFTKHGADGLARDQVTAEASLGTAQSPLEDRTALAQQYDVSLRGGSSAASYTLGGGYAHFGAYRSEGYYVTAPSVYGGLRLSRRHLTVDLSGRYYGTLNDAGRRSPAVNASGFLPYSKPFYEDAANWNQTAALQVGWVPVSWLRNNLTLGIDHTSYGFTQRQPRFTTPADSLLEVGNSEWRKASIAYNTTLTVPVGRLGNVDVTAGFDHYGFNAQTSYVGSATTTNGTINYLPAIPAFLSLEAQHNTGVFAQAQLRIADVLFLTGGARAEWNTYFGDSLGTPISPRAGVSYVHQLGATTLKLRGSYGESIKPPSAGEKTAYLSAASVQLANARLGPERQRGGDAGVDLSFGTTGTLSVTYYNQTASDLIQYVQLPLTGVSTLTFQYQNVGRVRNTGFEFEGGVELSALQLKGQFAITNSRVLDLGPNYTGDLLPGDRPLDVPHYTGGGAVTARPFAMTSITGGVTYVGGWTDLDYAALFGCFGGTQPCRAAQRDYHLQYPGFVKFNLAIAQEISPSWTMFASVENLANNNAYEQLNLFSPQGRLVFVGSRVSFGY